MIPGDVPKALPGSHDPGVARGMVEEAFDGRFTDVTKAQFERDVARIPDGTEIVTWGWRDGAAASHMMYGLKTGGDLRFYDQRGRLTAGQAGAELDHIRQLLVRGVGGNGGGEAGAVERPAGRLPRTAAWGAGRRWCTDAWRGRRSSRPRS